MVALVANTLYPYKSVWLGSQGKHGETKRNRTWDFLSPSDEVIIDVCIPYEPAGFS